MFRIAMNKGNTFVYLDSDSPNTLESFLSQQKNEIEQEYETDSEYGDDGRDYDGAGAAPEEQENPIHLGEKYDCISADSRMQYAR